MENLGRLSIQNKAVVDDILGTEYVEHSYEDILKVHEFIDGNEALAEHLYGNEIADLVKRHKQARLDKLQSEVVEAVSAPESSLNELDTSKLGVIVIRPEAIELVDQTRILLEQSGLGVVLDKHTKINFEQYWSLYGPGLRDPDSKYDFPTRTLNYMNRNIHILVVTANPDSLDTTPVSDYITNELKGRQGSYTPNTIRGDIAYTALRRLVNIDSTGFLDRSTNMALDPIGAYRQLVRGHVASDRLHSTADSPILFYAGQSMHVPNNEEIGRDLRVLLSAEDIALIVEKANNGRTTG